MQTAWGGFGQRMHGAGGGGRRLPAAARSHLLLPLPVFFPETNTEPVCAA